MIQGGLRLNSGTFITYQSAIVDTFSSTLYIEETIFNNIDLTSSSIRCSSSILSVKSINISEIHLADDNQPFPFIIISLDSIANIDRITYRASSVTLLNGIRSDLDINLVNIQGITAVNCILLFDLW